MTQQDKVFRDIRSAISILTRARDKEYAIETKRIQLARERQCTNDIGFEEGDLYRDPLGTKLSDVIDKLDNL